MRIEYKKQNSRKELMLLPCFLYINRKYIKEQSVCVRLYIFVFLLFITSATFAQSETSTEDSVIVLPEKLIISNPWLQATNAAALGIQPLPERGSVYLQGFQQEGDFRKAQEPDRTRQLVFQSERYQPVKAASIFGSFRFTQQWDDSIRFSDVLNPYHGTPYLLADSVGGDWKKQFYQLHMKMASGWLVNYRIKAGAGINYRNATGARQNDPRPLNYSNEFSISPSLLYQIKPNRHTGINGWYESFREEISLEIQKQGESHKLYKLLGLGEYTPPIGFSPSTNRTYQGKKYGGDLFYELHNSRCTWLTEAGIRAYQENVRDGASIPRPAGKLNEKDYLFSTLLQYNGSVLRKLMLTLQLQDYTGTEYHTTYSSTERKWIISAALPLYNSKVYNTSVSFELMKLAGMNDFKWLLHTDVAWSSMERKYIYPASRQYISRVIGTIRAGRNWFRSGANFQCLVSITYSGVFEADLDYKEMTTTSNLIARKVLYPDHDYMGAALWSTKYSMNYIFKQYKKNRFFIKADAELTRRSSEVTIVNGFDGSRTTFVFTVGSIY